MPVTILQVGKETGNVLACLAVLSDTHMPDRLDAYHPDLLPLLNGRKIDGILHAGDVSTRGVLEDLARIAPVTAVRGNRDLLFRPALPMLEFVHLAGVKIALMHGQFSVWNYLYDKFFYWKDGYDLARYQNKILAAAKDADVAIFGHTHYPECRMVGSVLLMNPGSVSMGPRRGMNPYVGFLFVFDDRSIGAEIIEMNGAVLRGRRWVRNTK